MEDDDDMEYPAKRASSKPSYYDRQNRKIALDFAIKYKSARLDDGTDLIEIATRCLVFLEPNK